MKHTDLIREHLEKHGAITALEAIELYGCLRLSARIWDLRHEGMNIASDRVTVKNRNGENCIVSRYSVEVREDA